MTLSFFSQTIFSCKCSGNWGGVGVLLRLAPGALAKDLVQVEGDGLLLNQALHLGLLLGGQNPHQSLGGKPGV